MSADKAPNQAPGESQAAPASMPEQEGLAFTMTVPIDARKLSAVRFRVAGAEEAIAHDVAVGVANLVAMIIRQARVHGAGIPVGETPEGKA